MGSPSEDGRLWAKGLPLDPDVHRFTVGDDPFTDLAFVPFDAMGSAAHALTLLHGGYIEAADARSLLAALNTIYEASRDGRFGIRNEQEDGHTAIEAELVLATGEAGKRIHLGRSRNDQMILALRLYLRHELVGLGLDTVTLTDAYLQYSAEYSLVPMPGYTHMRRAMPSSLGQWSAAFAEALLEQLEALEALYARLDRCPAGVAAGFGSPVSLDRTYTARILGFARVQRNPVDVQNSRGRHELAVLQWLAGVGNILEKFLWDVALYTTEEFGFFALPDAYTTGSSIMPQKRNPDVVELARASCRELRGEAALVEGLGTGLPSNYHRDLQLVKTPLVRALKRGRELVAIVMQLIGALEPVPERLRGAQGPELWAAHEASLRALEGIGFRDAYREVSNELRNGTLAPRAVADPPAPLLDSAVEELEDRRAWLHERVVWHSRHERGLWDYFKEWK